MASLLATDLVLIQRGGISYKMTGADLIASVQPAQGSVTLTLNGDASGSAVLDGSANVTLTVTVADNSHGHLTSDISGLDVTLSAKAPLASPTFTGTPTAPTAATATSTNQLATTAFVTNRLAAAGYAPLASPTFTGTPAAPTPAVGTNTTQLATTAFVASAITAGNFAKLNVAQNFSGAQRGAVVALTPAAIVTPSFAAGNNFSLALNQDTVLANPVDVVAGQSGVITITQDATARTLAYGSFWRFEGGIPTLGTTAGAVSSLAYYVNSATVITAKLINEPSNL